METCDETQRARRRRGGRYLLGLVREPRWKTVKGEVRGKCSVRLRDFVQPAGSIGIETLGEREEQRPQLPGGNGGKRR